MKWRRQKSFSERTAELFDLPGEVVAGQSRITITGTGSVYIDRHRGVLEYGEERICVRCGRCVAVIDGKNLRLDAMSSRELLVTGVIGGITFRR